MSKKCRNGEEMICFGIRYCRNDVKNTTEQQFCMSNKCRNEIELVLTTLLNDVKS